MANHNHANDNDHDEVEPRGFGVGLLTGLLAGLLTGLLTGGLAGAVTMLLLAPQSGKRTRAKLQWQSHELREQVAEAVEDAMLQARAEARQITHDAQRQAGKMEQRGQAMLDEQRDNLSSMVEAGKNAVQGNRD